MSMEINEMQEMNERAKKALEYHKKGYNCSQAVACSFCEEFGVDEETMFRIGANVARIFSPFLFIRSV